MVLIIHNYYNKWGKYNIYGLICKYDVNIDRILYSRHKSERENWKNHCLKIKDR